MSGFTLENLRNVDDSAPKFGYEELQEARFAGAALGAERTGVSFHRVKPNKRQGFGHRHDEAEEIYVIVRGSGRVKLGEEIVDVKELDAIRVAPEVPRQFEAGPDGLEYVVAGAQHEGDGELLPDFWPSE
jgi:mannose-6-phosphate isomerase-like protein (cupin superfamily)